MQIYTGALGTKSDRCLRESLSYFSRAAGRCLSYDGHAAYDYDLPSDAHVAVRAAASGCAVEVGSADAYGLRIVLRHPNGYETVYAHLDETKPHIAEEECVDAGDEIAFGGNTGCDCGAHLHFEVLDPQGEAADPYGWWGNGADPVQPTSGWLWIAEQPTTNGFEVTAACQGPTCVPGASLTAEREGKTTDMQIEIPGARAYVEAGLPAVPGEIEAQPARLPDAGVSRSDGGSVIVWSLVAAALVPVTLLTGIAVRRLQTS
jgi:hypothetical protein